MYDNGHGDVFNPFPGLRPFNRDESDLFFGRDEQSDDLLGRLRRNRFLAVVGSSGSGKSSLVKAGLLPSLFGGFMVRKGSVWRVAEMRPGGHPIGNLAEALNAEDVFGGEEEEDDFLPASEFTETTLRRGPLGLAHVTRQGRLEPDENLLVVVDQFEEIFRFREAAAGETEDDSSSFIKLLLNATDTALPIYVIITMRSDYLGDCAQFRNLPERINDGQYLIPRLTPDQIREAIVGPAAVGGAEVSPRLVQRLLGEVGDDPDQLPILQHALMRTWDVWDAGRGNNSGQIDLPHYRLTGGMAQALNKHANEIYAGLTPARHRIAKRIFQRLTEKDRETRRPTRFRELCAVADAEPAEVTAVIDVFRGAGRSFLMPPKGEELRPKTTVDISHESLMRVWTRLSGWASEEAEAAQLYSRLVRTAARHEEDPEQEGTMKDPALSRTLEWWARSERNEAWARRYDPEPEGVWPKRYTSGWKMARAFLDKSESAKRWQKGKVLAGVGLLLALAFGVLLLWTLASEYRERGDQLQEEKDKVQRLLEEAERDSEELAAKNLRIERFLEDEKKYTSRLEIKARELRAANAKVEERNLQLAVANRELNVERDLSEARRMANAALLQRDGNLDLSLLLSVQAFATTDHPDTRGSLLEVLQSAPRLDRFLGRHAAPVRNLAVSPDGTTLASIGADDTVRLWNLERGRPAGELETGQRGTVRALAYSPDGKKLALGDHQGFIRLLRAADRKPLAPPIAAHRGAVLDLAFSPPDGAALVSGGQDKVARIWDATSGKAIGDRLEGQHGRVRAVAFSRDGKMVAVSDAGDGRRGEEPRIRLRDVVTGQLVAELPVTGEVAALASSPGGDVLAAAGRGGKISLWDFRTGEPLAELVGHPRATVYSLAFRPDGEVLASGGTDRTVRLWSVASGAPAGESLEGHPGSISGLDFSPDGARLAVGGSLGAIYVWETGADQPHGRLVGRHAGGVTSIDFGSDETLVSVGRTRGVRFWELEAAAETPRPLLVARPGAIRAAAFSGDGRTLASVGDKLLLWDVTSGQLARDLLAEHGGGVGAVVISPDGRFVAAGSSDGRIRLWHAESAEFIGELEGHHGPVSALAFAPGERASVLASAGSDRTIRLWDLEAREQLAVFRRHLGKVRALAFSPGGATLASAGTDRQLYLWNVEARDPSPLGRASPSVGSVYGLEFSPDGRLLVVGASQGAVHFLDARTLKSARSRIRGALIRDLDLSPDGKLLAIVTVGGVDLWDVGEGRRIGRLGAARYEAVSFVLDGEALVAGGRGSGIRFWSTRTLREIGSERQPWDVGGLAFDDKTGLLAIAGLKGTLSLWEIEPVRLRETYSGLEGGYGTSPEVARSYAQQQAEPSGGRTGGGDGELAALIPRRLEVLLAGHPRDAGTVAWSADGRHLASAGKGPILLLWDIASEGPPKALLDGHSGLVATRAFDADGRTLVTGGSEDNLRLWDAGDLRASRVLLGPGFPEVKTIAFSPDRGTVALGRGDGTILFWDSDEPAPSEASLEGHDGAVTSLAFSADGSMLASGGEDERLVLWDVDERKRLGVLATDTGTLTGLAFNGDGGKLASGSGRSVQLWEVAEPVEPTLPYARLLPTRTAEVGSEGENVTTFLFSPDDRALVSGDSRGSIRIWDLGGSEMKQRRVHHEAHSGRVTGLAFNVDGKRFVSVGADRAVRRWSLANDTSKPPLEGHGAGVVSVVFSADGERILSGDDEGGLRVWSADSGELLASATAPDEDAVRGLAFSADGKTLAAGEDRGSILLWDVATGERLGGPLDGHAAAVGEVAFSRDGRLLASSDTDGDIYLWDLRGRSRLHGPFSGHSEEITDLSFSPDGSTLASAEAEGGIHFWEVATGVEVGEPFEGHTGSVTAIDYLESEGRLVSTGEDRTLRLWRTASPDSLGELVSMVTEEAQSVVLSADGQRVAVSEEGGSLRLWHTSSDEQPELFLPKKGGKLHALAFSPSGETLASGGEDGTVQLWDAESGESRGRRLTAGDSPIVTASFSHDGRVVAAGDVEGNVRFWDVGYRRPIQRVGAGGHTGEVAHLAFSGNGRFAASTDAGGRVVLWELEDRRSVRNVTSGELERLRSLAVSPDGRLIASGGYDGEIRVWSLADGELVRSVRAHSGSIYGLAFSPDSERLASAGRDDRVLVWNLETFEHREKRGFGGAAYSVAFSPDGRLMAAGGRNGAIRLFDAGTLAEQERLRARSILILGLAFSPNGRVLASSDGTGAIRLWNTANGQQIGEDLREGRGWVRSVAFSPDGRTLAAGGQDGFVRVWGNLRSRQPRLVGPAGRHGEDSVRAVAFSPGGDWLVSAGDDGRLRFWDANGAPSSGPVDTGIGAEVRGMSILVDGSQVAAAASDGRIHFFDARTRRRSRTLAPETLPEMSSVAFSPDGRTVALGGVDGSILFWDTEEGRALGSPIPGLAEEEVVRLVFGPRGNYLAAASTDSVIRLWDVASRQPIGQPMTGHEGDIMAVAFRPDGKALASGDDQRAVLMWRVPSGERLAGPFDLSRGQQGAKSVLGVLGFSPDGRYLLEGDRRGAGLWRVWNGERPDLEKPLKTFEELRDGVRNLRFARRRALIARDSAEGRGNIRIWEWEPGGSGVGAVLSAGRSPISAVAVSADGARMATATHGGALRLWRAGSRPHARGPAGWKPMQDLLVAKVRTLAFGPSGSLAVGGSDGSLLLWRGEEKRLLAGHSLNAEVSSIAFGREGAILASGDSAGNVMLWDAESGQRLGDPLGGHTGSVVSLAFEPGDGTLASGDSSGIIRLWDLASREQVGGRLELHSQSVTALAFDSGGEILASGSEDLSVVLWDLESRLPIGDPLTGHSSRVEKLTFRPSAESDPEREGTGILVSGDAAGGLRLWDVNTRKPLGNPLRGHSSRVMDLVFSADGSTVISAARDGIWSWDVDLESWRARACCKANRNLSLAEWNEHIGPDVPYQRICDWLPPGEGAEALTPLSSDDQLDKNRCELAGSKPAALAESN